MPDDRTAPLLQVENLKRQFQVRQRGSRESQLLRAVDGVSLHLEAGESLGVVGESGCGKSTLARLIVGLLKPTEGRILIDGQDIWTPGAAGRDRRRKFQMVFQNPAGSMNPRRTVGASVAEPLTAKGVPNASEAVERMLELVGLDPSMASRKPHQLSGGQQQRASIARALIADPAIVVHDESIASLDISLQAQILNLLLDLQKDLGTSYIFISHDLAAVQAISHRVVVMYLGEVVEASDSTTFAQRPLHPYSLALRSATLLPDPVHERGRGDTLLRGDVPSPINPPSGCRFHTRCPLAKDLCLQQKPALRDAGSGHLVACHYAGDTTRPLEMSEEVV
ncbi:ABC transporter ATP-binding protein [Tropicimonas sp. IMCC6043]|uniref:ABC transporter ATP-binding protein n=1 Tax=Tropicimonas sp. IMCC6043 TaxID=2510645 RepID=UPI00101D3A0C|nr:oligopeptide/dipeptide ABC transporter ATP-binding protein [Tropicimonas sp. IMCC6043]RYH07534.1 ATP-binding cassette domain-containing protein [Tropicimonas sp. IMCC6043]